MRNQFKNLTAVLITFLRPEYTKKCVDSLIKNYPGIKIVVGENGEYNEELHKFLEERNIRYKLFPFDSGICIARNHLVDECETDYVLVGDDDFFYTPDSKVDKMLTFMKNHKEFVLIGGRVSENNVIRNYQGYIKFFQDHIQYTPVDLLKGDFKIDKKSGLKYLKCDLTFNYFVARVKDIKPYKWDEKIKVAWEHSDWFIQLKHSDVPVAFSPDPVVVHKPEGVYPAKKELYQTYRMRLSDKERFFDKHKIDYILDMAGRTYKREMVECKRTFYATRQIFFEDRWYNEGEIITTDKPNEFMRQAIL
jgi:glycosyltransferase involved in cell wall biosynthesis